MELQLFCDGIGSHDEVVATWDVAFYKWCMASPTMNKLSVSKKWNWIFMPLKYAILIDGFNPPEEY
jgi:hypothetical protein